MENKDLMRMMSPPAGQVMPQFLMQNPGLGSAPTRNLVDPSLMAAALSHAQMTGGMMVNPFMKDVKDMMVTHPHSLPASQAVAQLSQDNRRLSDTVSQSTLPDHLRMGALPQHGGHPYNMQQHQILTSASHPYMIHGGVDTIAGHRDHTVPPVTRSGGGSTSNVSSDLFPLNMAQDRGNVGAMNFDLRDFSEDSNRGDRQQPASTTTASSRATGSQAMKSQSMVEIASATNTAGTSPPKASAEESRQGATPVSVASATTSDPFPGNMAPERGGDLGGIDFNSQSFSANQDSGRQDGQQPVACSASTATVTQEQDPARQQIKAQPMVESGPGQTAGANAPSKDTTQDSGNKPTFAEPISGTSGQDNPRDRATQKQLAKSDGIALNEEGKAAVHNLPVKVEPVFDQYTLNALASLAEAQARVQQSLLSQGVSGCPPAFAGPQPACSSGMPTSTAAASPNVGKPTQASSSAKNKKSPGKCYPCLECEKVFQRPEKLREHEMQHTGLRPYQCESCPKAYTNAHRLKVHSWSHAGLKPYKCQLCQKEFSKSDKLKRHEVTHTDIRPYNCSFCNRAFRRKDHVQNHERIHTGIKPHRCKHCDKCFARIDHCRKHEKTHFHVRNSSAGTGASVKVEARTQTQTGTQTDDIIGETSGSSMNTGNLGAPGPVASTAPQASTASSNLCSAALQTLASDAQNSQQQQQQQLPRQSSESSAVKVEGMSDCATFSSPGHDLAIPLTPYQRPGPQGLAMDGGNPRMQFYSPDGAANVTPQMIPFRSQVVFPSGIPVTGSGFNPQAPSTISRSYSPIRP